LISRGTNASGTTAALTYVKVFAQPSDLPGFFGPFKARERCLQIGLK
jgi:hypothetical protein